MDSPGKKKKVKFLLFMDVATKLRAAHVLYLCDFLEMKAESGSRFIESLSEKWLSLFPRPRVVILDSAKSFMSEQASEFLTDLQVLVHYAAEKEPWANGVIEAAIQDVKHPASATYLEAMDVDLSVTLHMAVAALNATEFTAGYSAHQWAFGASHQPTDEDRQALELVVRCSVHSVRPVNETERFQHEITAEEDFTRWRSLADVLPRREYTDMVDQAPQDGEVELPNLPERPDPTTIVVPQRRLRQKVTYKPGEYQQQPVNERLQRQNLDEEIQETPSVSSSTTRPLLPPDSQLPADVNDYQEPETKRMRVGEAGNIMDYDLHWVQELEENEPQAEPEMDISTAMEETNEFLKIEIDLPAKWTNRQRKMLERNPVAFLVKKMKDSEVVLSRLHPSERELFGRAKAKEVDSFIKNPSVSVWMPRKFEKPTIPRFQANCQGQMGPDVEAGPS